MLLRKKKKKDDFSENFTHTSHMLSLSYIEKNLLRLFKQNIGQSQPFMLSII